MFHLAAYFEQLANVATDQDINAVADTEFTLRNSHFIFTEAYDLLGAFYSGTGALRARFNVPTLNTFGRHQLFPLARSATIPDMPYLIDYRDMPLRLPINEEIAIEGVNNAGAANDTNVALFVAPPTWNKNLPRGIWRLNMRATYAITTVAQTWSGGANLTFADNLRGGWYAVIGMEVVDPNCLYARLIFPRGNVVNGRRLRPGCLADNAFGARPWPDFSGGMGLYGKFHSFEPPTIEIIANDAAAHTGEVRLDLVYLGDMTPAGM